MGDYEDLNKDSVLRIYMYVGGALSGDYDFCSGCCGGTIRPLTSDLKSVNGDGNDSLEMLHVGYRRRFPSRCSSYIRIFTYI